MIIWILLFSQFPPARNALACEAGGDEREKDPQGNRLRRFTAVKISRGKNQHKAGTSALRRS